MKARFALLLALVVVVAAGGAATTSARWTEEEPLGAGTVSAGQLSLLTGAGTERAQQYTFSALSGQNLGPGSYRQAPLTVFNDGDVDQSYLRTGVDFGALSGQASLTSTRVPNERGCPPRGNPTRVPGSMTTPRNLAVGESEVWCIRVTLGDRPAQNAEVPVAITIAAEQVEHAG